MKILRVSQDGSRFALKIQTNDKSREVWHYERTEHNGLVSYSLVEREER